MNLEDLKPAWKPVLAIIIVLFATTLVPILAIVGHQGMSNRMVDFLLFLPQNVFPFGQTHFKGANQPIGDWLTWLLWGIVTAVFAWVHVRFRVGFGYALLHAVVVVAVVTCLFHLVISMLGLEFFLDGP